MTPQDIKLHGDQGTILLVNEYDADVDQRDITLSTQIGEMLHQQYPGHLWAVRADSSEGLISIHNLMISGQWGVRVKMDNAYSASHLRKKVVMAAGELLERFKVARGRIDDDKMADMQTDYAGRVLGDYSK